jgi:hypothetical protein
MRNTSIFTLLVLLLPAIAIAQKIDNLSSIRDIKNTNYFRFHYDNDYFAASDKNYTQGYSFELATPFFKNNPANYLFLKPKEVETRYGLAIEHIGFTPGRYDLPEIQVGDRPFAAAIFLKSFVIATDSINKSRFTSSFNLGIIGPAAYGGEMQIGIHEATGNKTPRGWGNQIKNDLVMNYEVGYEKQLLQYKDLFSIQAQANTKIGTLFTNASMGFNSMIGIINSPFSSAEKRNGFQLYAYVQPILNVIGYDATLQGGLFHRSSPYTVDSRNLERLNTQFNYGIVLKTKTLYLEYTRSIISKEFNTGETAKWGGIRIGFTI